MADLTHLDESNQPHMVDVSAKTPTIRIATASCLVKIGTELISQMDGGELKNKKGPVLHTAILAGISGTKKTSELIPLCHEQRNLRVRLLEGNRNPHPRYRPYLRENRRGNGSPHRSLHRRL